MKSKLSVIALSLMLVGVANAQVVEVGQQASATGAQATAVGVAATASGDYATSVGLTAQAPGLATVAVGNNAQALSDYSVSLGSASYVTGQSSTAIGSGANSQNINSVALGYNSATTRDGEVSVGGRVIGQVASAQVSTDAVNLSDLRNGIESEAVRSNAYADLIYDKSVSYTDAQINPLRSEVADLRNDIRGFDKRIDSSNAMAAAQSNIIFNPYGSRFQLGVGAGYSGSSSALSVKVMGSSADKSRIFSAGLTAGSKGVSVGGGVTFNLR